jgi:hypothetical protein
MVNMLVRERAPAVAASRPTPGRLRLGAMIPRLEHWLRQEEVSLQLARAHGRVSQRREARWQELLRLYERICSSGAP